MPTSNLLVDHDPGTLGQHSEVVLIPKGIDINWPISLSPLPILPVVWSIISCVGKIQISRPGTINPERPARIAPPLTKYGLSVIS